MIWSTMRLLLAEYGVSLGYDQGGCSTIATTVISMEASILWSWTPGVQQLAVSVAVADSLERPGVVSVRDAPLYFSLSAFR